MTRASPEGGAGGRSSRAACEADKLRIPPRSGERSVATGTTRGKQGVQGGEQPRSIAKRTAADPTWTSNAPKERATSGKSASVPSSGSGDSAGGRSGRIRDAPERLLPDKHSNCVRAAIDPGEGDWTSLKVLDRPRTTRHLGASEVACQRASAKPSSRRPRMEPSTPREPPQVLSDLGQAQTPGVAGLGGPVTSSERHRTYLVARRFNRTDSRAPTPTGRAIQQMASTKPHCPRPRHSPGSNLEIIRLQGSK